MPEVIRLVINEEPADIQVREYQGQRVVSLRDIDELHRRPEGTAARNFSSNKKHFVEGVDFFRLTPDDANSTKNVELLSPNGLTVFTESGYSMLVKSFTDDLSWGVQRELVNGYFRTKQAPPRSTGDMLVMFAEAFRDHEQQIAELKLGHQVLATAATETKAEVEQLKFSLGTIEARAQEAEQELLALPEPAAPAAGKSTRATLVQLVNNYCRAESCGHDFAWGALYSEFRARYHIDLKARCRGKKEKPLDVAEALHVMDKLYAVAHELFGSDGSRRPAV